MHVLCIEGLSLLKDVTGVTLIPLFERPPESNTLQRLHLSCRKVKISLVWKFIFEFPAV